MKVEHNKYEVIKKLSVNVTLTKHDLAQLLQIGMIGFSPIFDDQVTVCIKLEDDVKKEG